MRCFVAVDIPVELREKIAGLQTKLKGDVRLVEPENLHFTLKFLGEVDMKAVGEVEKKLKELADRTSAFDMAIENAGVFPDEKFIRVIWIGGSGLLNLQTSVEDALADLFKKEKPVPHLTLARVRSQTGVEKIREFVENHRNYKIGSMRVSEIKIKKSTITGKGPVYEDIGVFELMG